MTDCPSCGALFEGQWHDDSIDLEQMDEPPAGDQLCPECGKVFTEAYPGWVNFGDA